MTRTPSIALTALLLTLALAASVTARPGKIVTKDGKTWEGDITELPRENLIEVVIDGKRHRFSMANLARKPEYSDPAPESTPAQPAAPGQTPEQEYEKRRTAIADNDAAGLVRLARWAFERKMYDQAFDAAQDARNADPRNREAQDLLRTVDAQRRLNRKAQQPPPGGRPGPVVPAPGITPPPGGNAPAKATSNGLVRPLSPEEVNRMRLLEWRGETGVKIRLLNDVKRRYLARADMQPAEFNRLNAVNQAWEIKKKGNPELLNDIRMTNDPPAFQDYRTIVQRAVLSTCATTACHGGGAGSDRFALHPRADHEGEAYANFLTMHKYQFKPEKGRQASMIDRNRPEDSLLIQFGLPANVSNMPHPEVDGYKPLFRTVNEPRYKQFVRWIADDLSPLLEDYGVPFDEAGDGGNAQPAAAAQQQQPADSAAGNDLAPGQQPAGPAAPSQQPPASGGRPAAPPPRQGGAR